jgi:hypothetical protein
MIRGPAEHSVTGRCCEGGRIESASLRLWMELERCRIVATSGDPTRDIGGDGVLFRLRVFALSSIERGLEPSRPLTLRTERRGLDARDADPFGIEVAPGPALVNFSSAFMRCAIPDPTFTFFAIGADCI